MKGFAIVLAYWVLGGCYLPASPPDRADVLATLRAHERGKADRDAPRPMNVQGLENARIRVAGRNAQAEYSVSPLVSQFAFVPIRVDLTKAGAEWQAAGEHDNWPWWWHLASHTAGVK